MHTHALEVLLHLVGCYLCPHMYINPRMTDECQTTCRDKITSNFVQTTCQYRSVRCPGVHVVASKRLWAVYRWVRFVKPNGPCIDWLGVSSQIAGVEWTMRFPLRISECISTHGFIDPPGAVSAGFTNTLCFAAYFFYNGMMNLWRRFWRKYCTSLLTGYNEEKSF